MLIYEQARDALVKKLGPDHPSTLITMHNLASAYLAAGKRADAIELLEQVRDAQARRLPANHPEILSTLNNLASAYQSAGRASEAMVLYEQAAEGVEQRRFQHQHAGRAEVAARRQRARGDVPAEPGDRDHIRRHADRGERGDERVGEARRDLVRDEAQ